MLNLLGDILHARRNAKIMDQSLNLLLDYLERTAAFAGYLLAQHDVSDDDQITEEYDSLLETYCELMQIDRNQLVLKRGI